MSFFVELWESVFTPGPTPTILRATNITFFVLQGVLALLLYATSSVHFVILSVLCAGLWRSVNWFAAELVAAQEREKTGASATTSAAAAAAPTAERDAARHSSDDSDTEVEDEGRASSTRPRAAVAGVEALDPRGEMRRRPAAAAALEPVDADGAELQPQSSASTEDEWERVSESEDKQ